MRLLKDNMIGRYFPFFLHNNPGQRSYFLYQIYTPGLSPNGFPWVSLDKIIERTNTSPSSYEPYGGQADILAWAMGINGKKPKIATERGLRWLRGCNKYFPEEILFEKDKFPRIEMDPYSQTAQKSLIISLRDAIRMSRYKFNDGLEIDALYDRNHYIVFRINNDKKTITLTPLAMYKVDDVERKNPLPVPTDLKETDPSLFAEFKPEEVKRMGGLVKTLREFEWKSFDRGFENEYRKKTEDPGERVYRRRGKRDESQVDMDEIEEEITDSVEW